MTAGRGRLLAGAGVLVLLVLGAVTYMQLGRHSSQPALRLAASPLPRTPAAASLSGTWVVDQGSVAGYRVRERFVGQAADSEAVARTSVVTGKLVLASRGAGLEVQQASFSADISKLHSEDANATYNGAVRDNFVGRIYLDSAVYPLATYQARLGPLQATTLPADLQLPGTFTVHGVTHDVSMPLKVAQNGDRLEVLASFSLHYSDYHVDVPQVPFTTAAPDATIEVHLFLRRQP